MRLTNLAMIMSTSSIAIIGLQPTPAHAATTTSSQALLVGKLGYEGGAPPETLHRTAGTVVVDFDSETPLTLVHQVGTSGSFSIPLPPGKYTVIGCGPSTSGSGSNGQCSKPVQLTLTTGEVDRIKLIWARVP